MKAKANLSNPIIKNGQVLDEKSYLKQKEETNEKDVSVLKHGAYWVFDMDSITCPECKSNNLNFDVNSTNISENHEQRFQMVVYVAVATCNQCGCKFSKTRPAPIDIIAKPGHVSFGIRDNDNSIKKPIDCCEDPGPISFWD